MADKTINQLTEETTSATGDFAPIWDTSAGATKKVSLANIIPDGSVTAGKRSQVVASGVITGSTLGTTGNKSITGVGFTPKLVQFYVMPSASTSVALGGFGYMTASAQAMTTHAAQPSTPSASRTSATNRCIGWLAAGSTTLVLACSYVSMDSDGFTINVDSAANNFDVLWIAFA